MNNTETPATLDTRHKVKTNKTKNTTEKTKRMSNMETHQKNWVNSGAGKG